MNRGKTRSPLATNNYFSKFDKIVEERLAQAAETIDEGSVVNEKIISRSKIFRWNSHISYS